MSKKAYLRKDTGRHILKDELSWPDKEKNWRNKKLHSRKKKTYMQRQREGEKPQYIQKIASNLTWLGSRVKRGRS